MANFDIVDGNIPVVVVSNAGIRGAQGTTGIQGSRGTQGLIGLQGVQGITGASGSSSSFFDYLIETNDLTGNPGAGNIGYNNVNQIDSTQLRVSHTTSNGTDIDFLLQNLKANDSIIIQDVGDSSDYQQWVVTGSPTTVPNQYITYPVNYVTGTGMGETGFVNGETVILIAQSSGVQGTTGLQGVQGIQGLIGVGLQGVQGRTGSQGTQGTQGTQGVQGTVGSQGTTGAQGSQGTQGLVGLQGTQGIQGVQGTQGTQGIQGNEGLQGLTGTQGTFGIQGTQGSVGQTGSQGTTGTQGLTGIQGFTGATGDTGAQGTVGSQGTQGTLGLQGTQGLQGLQGIKGDTGSQGTQGTTGIQGSVGAQGEIGAQGLTGSQGVQGLLGIQGSQGESIQGTTGAQGAQGLEGIQGAQGATGAQGLIGQRGIQGIAGTDGAQGLIGAQGTTGSQGTEGIQGHTGAQGFTGAQGSIGVQGITGLQGLQGTTGTQGLTGTQGTQGIQGEVGAQGQTGTQGLTGIQGTQGIQGQLGAQGIQGLTGAGGSLAYYGSFYDNTTQVPAAINTPYPVAIGFTTDSFGVNLSNGNRINLTASGTYSITYSVQVKSLSNAMKNIQVWLGKNGAYVNETNSDLSLSINNEHDILTVNYVLPLNVGDYLQLFYAVSDTNIQITSATPLDASPNIPSVIATVTQVAYSIQGATGATGPQGITGLQGLAGTQGTAGLDGAQGTTGTQGATGQTGLQGLIGLQGIQGSVGAQGFTGIQGLEGIQGVEGAQGTQGTQGLIGSQGLAGIQGLEGIQGHTGAQGTTGANGINGDTGAQGTTGSQGATGAQGTKGDTGLTGAQGIQGLQGLQGVDGAQGTTGAQGTAGVIGVDGAQGTQGTQGTQGLEGTQGLAGIQGTTGLQGLTGSQGTEGIQGHTGAQGTQGLQGFTGTQGLTGIQGLEGTQGTVGAQGLVGSQGIQGTLGLQGTQGIQGVIGSQGTQGTQGIIGNSNGVAYTFSTTTADADPGNGLYRFNSGSLGSITTMYISKTDGASQNQAAWIASWDDSTNTSNYGYIYINTRDITNDIARIFKVTGTIVDATTYFKVPVSFVSGSGVGPGNNNTPMVLAFSMSGNAGVQGVQGLTGSQGTIGAQGTTGSAPTTAVLSQTTNYTLQASDIGDIIRMNSATATTVTVPSDATASIPVGSSIQVFNDNTGVVTIAGGFVSSAPAGAVWDASVAAPGGSNIPFGKPNVLNYINGQWVSGGIAQVFISTNNGTSWTAQATTGISLQINEVIYVNSTYYAVTNDIGIYTATALNGTWTQRLAPGSGVGQLNGIIWTGSIFVAYGRSFSTGAIVYTSTDGTTWTLRTVTGYVGNEINAMSYTAGRFVGVGTSVSYTTSTDGINWTSGQFSGITGTMRAIAHNPDSTWIAVGDSGNMRYTFDGTNWSALSIGQPAVRIRAITYNTTANVWVMANDNREVRYATNSSFDTTWTLASPSPITTTAGNAGALEFGNGVVIAVVESSFVTSAAANITVTLDYIDTDNIVTRNAAVVLTKIADNAWFVGALSSPPQMNWTTINSGGTALSTQSAVTISNLSGYKKLMVVVRAATMSVANNIGLQFNGDAGNKYSQFGFIVFQGGSAFPVNNLDTTQLMFGNPGSSSGNAVTSIAYVDNTNYPGKKYVNISSGAGNGGSGYYSTGSQGWYDATVPITSVTVRVPSGTFAAGLIYLYGAN